jgi:hypothetical protein
VKDGQRQGDDGVSGSPRPFMQSGVCIMEFEEAFVTLQMSDRHQKDTHFFLFSEEEQDTPHHIGHCVQDVRNQNIGNSSYS